MATEIRRMQQKYGTTAAWAAANPVLSIGEIGYEQAGTGWYRKIGNGADTWDNLPYEDSNLAIPNNVPATTWQLLSIDLGKDIFMDSVSDSTVTIPLNVTEAIQTNFVCMVWATGGGAVTLQAEAGVSLNGEDGGSYTIRQLNGSVFLQKTAADEWILLAQSAGMDNVRVVSANDTFAQDDTQIHCSANDVTLPSLASTPVGKRFLLKNRYSAGGAAQIVRAGSDTIDGATSVSLAAGEFVEVINNGQEWATIR